MEALLFNSFKLKKKNDNNNNNKNPLQRVNKNRKAATRQQQKAAMLTYWFVSAHTEVSLMAGPRVTPDAVLTAPSSL